MSGGVKPTVVIFGINGMLGSACFQYFSNCKNSVGQHSFTVIGYSRKDFDAKSLDLLKLEREAEEQWPTNSTVINAIGIIPQRGKVSDSDYVLVNSVFPHVLSGVCRRYGHTLIHVTTDCVYDGSQGPYAEGAPPTEKSIYGVSKACGEPADAMVIRTSIIGLETSRPGVSLLEWVRSCQGKTIKGYCDHFWNGVTCLQLAKFIEQCINLDIRWRGLRHVVSPDSISKYQLVKLIAKIFNVDCEIKPVHTLTAGLTVNKVLLPSPSIKGLPRIPPLVIQLQELYLQSTVTTVK